MEIDLDDKDYYCNRENEDRTRQRLVRCKEMGMMEYGNYQFHIPNTFSGLWIEKVWRFTDEEFDDYLQWVQTLIDKKENKK